MSEEDIEITPARIREVTYSEEKRRTDFRSHLWAYLVARPLSFYIAPLFLRFGISANQVTLLGGGVLLAGLAGIVLGPYHATFLITGTILVNLWYLLDFVDGCIARYDDGGNPFGAFLDWFVGVIHHIGIPIAVALTLFQSNEFSALITYTEVSIIPIIWLSIALLDVIAQLFRKVIDQKIQLLHPEKTSNDLSEGFSLTMLAGAFSSFKTPLLFLSAVTFAIDLWLLLYFVFNIAVLGPQLLIKGRQLADSS